VNPGRWRAAAAKPASTRRPGLLALYDPRRWACPECGADAGASCVAERGSGARYVSHPRRCATAAEALERP
jgi:hypothetical protein